MAGGGGQGTLLGYFARHRTAANLLMLLLLVLGAAAGTQIRSQFFPDIVIESIDVSVRWDGAGPEDVDRAIVGVLEPVLLAVDGVEDVSSRATEGRARLDVDFGPGQDMAAALDAVTVAVDGVTGLPEGAERPEIRQSRWRDRVTDVVISGPSTPEQLGRHADEFVQRLYRAGVTATTVNGVTAPRIRVDVPEAALIRHGLTLREVADAIGAQASGSPAGEVAGGGARVRTGAERRTAAEIAAMPVRAGPDGAQLTVGEVARVVPEGAAAGRAYYTRGNPAVTIRVDRSAEGDAIAIQRTVARVAEELQPLLPAGTEIELIRTRAQAITDRLDILYENGAIGLALVLALLFLFLSARTAFWVAAGIPVAMFAAVAVMYALGLTLNMISLFALIITLGIVVDDAIVVGEHADFRHRRLGEPPAVAAERAARRMFAPVFSATITTVLAFTALVAVGGRFGSLIADIPLTVIAVLVASLVECFVILPAHMNHAMAAKARGPAWYDWPSRRVNAGFRVVRERVFRPAIGGVIRARYPVLAGAVLVLSLSAGLVLRGEVAWRFFDAPEQGSVTGNIAMLPGADRADTRAMVQELQRATTAVAARLEAEHGQNPVTFALAQVGGTAGRGLSGQDAKDPDQLGGIAIELIGADLRPYSGGDFVALLQDEVRRQPMLETLSFRSWRGGPGGDALDVEFYGAGAAVLKAAAEDLKTAVAAYPEVSGVEDNLPYDKEQISLELTPMGRALGFSTEAVGRALRDRLNGIEAARFPAGSRTATVRVALPEAELTADFLDRTRLRGPGGEWVQLSQIVTAERGLGFSTVRRENGRRVVSVQGDIDQQDATRAAAIMAELRGDILPAIASRHGVEWRLGGLAEQEREFLSDAALGFALCLVGIYLTLTWIFASWTRPLIVMSVIPFGLIGVIWGHWAWGVPMSIFTVVGLIGMSGIIINDSIVLVTTIDEHARARALLPAIVEAACDRLRPVLLTTLTTVLGLAPLLYESSEQAQFLKPTVITLAYGLGVGMVLVLLVVPALVAAQQDLGRIRQSTLRAARRFRRLPGRARGALALAAGGSAMVLAATLGRHWAAGATGGGMAAAAAMLAGLAVVNLTAWALAAAPRRRRRG